VETPLPLVDPQIRVITDSTTLGIPKADIFPSSEPTTGCQFRN
jgi:hypothetical protein